MSAAPSDRPDDAGAPGPEIEITPEMEIAGVRLLRDQFPDATGTSYDRATVRELFLAMYRASLRSRCAADKHPQREDDSFS
jgi:hypothetical protein